MGEQAEKWKISFALPIVSTYIAQHLSYYSEFSNQELEIILMEHCTEIDAIESDYYP